jgi:predicted nuclease of restriction endonuclease-like (RecB) superfamily
MSKRPKKGPPESLANRPTADPPSQADFDEVLRLIDAARARAVAAVNTALIDLYWQIGEYLSQRIAAAGWGQGTVKVLAEYIQRHQPNARGFSASNLWRMMQFFVTYRDQPKLATLLRELSWSHNLAIMSRSRRDEEREFYLRLAARERWTFRELQRQLNGALFEQHSKGNIQRGHSRLRRVQATGTVRFGVAFRYNLASRLSTMPGSSVVAGTAPGSWPRTCRRSQARSAPRSSP